MQLKKSLRMTQCPIILYLECFNLLGVVRVSPTPIQCKANSQIIRSVAWSQNMKEFKSKHRVNHVIHIRASVSSMGKIIRNRACMRLLRGSLLFCPRNVAIKMGGTGMEGRCLSDYWRGPCRFYVVTGSHKGRPGQPSEAG